MEELLLFRRRGGNGDAASHESGGCLAADQDITFATFLAGCHAAAAALFISKLMLLQRVGSVHVGRGGGVGVQHSKGD